MPFEGIDDYIEYFNIQENDNGTITLYKAVHKSSDGVLYSDWNQDFTYQVGKKAFQEDVDTNVYEDCGVGLHVSTLSWALTYGRNFKNLAIIECEVPKDKLIVYKFTDGKIRTSELTVIREVSLEECGILGKIIKKGIK